MPTYIESIENLFKITHVYGSSGAEIAAKILLSVNFGSPFLADLNSLRGLDSNLKKSAIELIRYNASSGKSPEFIIENGHERFSKLRDYFD